MTIEEATIQANIVSFEDRMDFLPDFFGMNLMLVGEGVVYSWMDRLSEDYSGGYWDFYKLSNGGFYLAPNYKDNMRIEVVGNYYHGTVSADAAGIIATMFALGQLAAEFPDQEYLIDHYHSLREYIGDHPECSEIFAAID